MCPNSHADTSNKAVKMGKQKSCPHLLHNPRARMHHKVVGSFGSEADVRSLYYRRFRGNETSDVGSCTHGRPGKYILTDLCPRYFESEPDFRPMHTKFERLLSKSLTTLEVMMYDLVVHTGPGYSVRGEIGHTKTGPSSNRAAW